MSKADEFDEFRQALRDLLLVAAEELRIDRAVEWLARKLDR